MNLIRPAVLLFIVLTAITGVLYPLAVTGSASCFSRALQTAV